MENDLCIYILVLFLSLCSVLPVYPTSSGSFINSVRSPFCFMLLAVCHSIIIVGCIRGLWLEQSNNIVAVLCEASYTNNILKGGSQEYLQY